MSNTPDVNVRVCTARTVVSLMAARCIGRDVKHASASENPRSTQGRASALCMLSLVWLSPTSYRLTDGS